jgi:hypothetical protein
MAQASLSGGPSAGAAEVACKLLTGSKRAGIALQLPSSSSTRSERSTRATIKSHDFRPQRRSSGDLRPAGLSACGGFVFCGRHSERLVRSGAVGAGAQNIRAADVSPEERKPTPSVVGERMITKKGVFGIVQGHANRHLAIASLPRGRNPTV